MPDPRIEFVPFPEPGDDDPSAASGERPEVVAEVPEVVGEVPEVVDPDDAGGDDGGVSHDAVAEGDGGDDSDAPADSPPEPHELEDLDLAEVDELAEVTEVEGAEHVAEPEPEPEPGPEPDGATGDAPAPLAIAPRRVPGGAAAGTELALRDERVVRPSAPVDDAPGAGLRRWAIPTRVLLMAMASVLCAGIVALVSIWGISRSSAAATDVAATGDASRAAAELTAALGSVRTSAGEALDEQLRRADRLADRVVETAPVGVDPDAVERVRTSVDEVVRLGGDDAALAADPTALDTPAIAASSSAFEVMEMVDDQRAVLARRVEDARRTTVVGSLVALLVGTFVLIGLSRAVTGSIVGPLRLLGRAMRRFADGDTGSRGAEHSDEVGLLARSFNYSADAVGSRIERLSADAARGTQLRMVSDALDLADDEADVHRIVARAFGILAPGHPAELMVHDTTSTRLREVAVHPVAGSPGCPVDSTPGCVAMRRAQAVTFDGPSAINACPRLRDRDQDCSAACVPVSVNGHLLGVMHVTAPEGDPPAPELVEQLVTLAGQVGTRIGAMRTLEVTRMQASTDGLTGLANRRMLEARVGDLVRNGTPFVLAVADLDHFTQINNNYGHEAGDRALQLFAGVLEDNVRGHDIVARFGGEEFVLVYPEMSVKPSMEAIERVRVALARAVERAGVPPFTCSFGVTHSSVGDSVESIIRIADAGLLTAKDLGRNRVVYADEDLAAEVFGPGATDEDGRRSPPRPATPSADIAGDDDVSGRSGPPPA